MSTERTIDYVIDGDVVTLNVENFKGVLLETVTGPLRRLYCLDDSYATYKVGNVMFQEEEIFHTKGVDVKAKRQVDVEIMILR